MSMQTPAFAVVGHPNKGKSSLVATLAQDDSVKISIRPGTTVASRRFPMQVDGKVLYELIDTPGFQRSRQALAWLKAHETGIDLRSEVIKSFIDTFSGQDKFQDECELLRPIVEGAGILYVVDGSKPYGSEFEAEMEILRWTGQPRMALINLIGTGNHVEHWRRALSQFFQIVRVFNAVTADFDKHIELLRAFGQLREEWRQPLEDAVNYLIEDRHKRRQQSAQLIAQLIAQSLGYKLTAKHKPNNSDQADRNALKHKFYNALQEQEQQARKMIEQLFYYHNINRQEAAFKLIEEDLFSENSWSVFGLSQQELLMTGMAAGAAMGAVVDLAVGGSSLLLGAGIGAIAGSLGALFSYDKLADIKILGMALGAEQLQIGPITNRNFPYVLLGRAMAHYQLINDRTHAMRDVLELSDQQGNMGASKISPDQRKQFEVQFVNIRKNGSSPRTLQKLSSLIEQCI